MSKALVLYASKYGSTKELAEVIGEELRAEVFEVAHAPEDFSGYELVVLGSPLYCANYLESMNHFLRNRGKAFAGKAVAAFVLGATELEIQPGLTGEEDETRYTQDEWAEGLAKRTAGRVIAFRGFGGRMVANQLDLRDRGMLEWFFRYLMRKPLEGFDQIDLEQVRLWARGLPGLVSSEV
ncbi:MAG: flavodoxin domain-containing protein [Myxococcota bacterium]|jgi:menaquinone-dependent protoporphyrinogen oxidase|nr:flavodoxin domain-containing protein [Myxococcota bacterium]